MLKNRTILLTVVCAILQTTNTYCTNFYNNINDIILELDNNDINNNNNINDISFRRDTQFINQNNQEILNFNNITTEEMINQFNDNNSIDIEFNDIDNQRIYFINNSSDLTQNNIINNNNQHNIIIDLSSNDYNNGNKKTFLGKKSKRFKAKKTGNSIQNVKLNYKELMNANKKIKSCMSINIDRAKEAYDFYNESGYPKIAESYLESIKLYTKLDSDEFPILDDLNITNIRYDNFKIHNTVQKVHKLKNIIQNMIDYEDKNCELKSKDYKILKKILRKIQNDEMTKQMFKALRNIGVISRNPNRIRFFESKQTQIDLFNLDDIRKYFENACDSNDNDVFKKSVEKFCYDIINTNYVKLLFKKQSGVAAKVISNRFIQVIMKILTRMSSSGLNNEFMKLRLINSNTTFDLMEQRIINGEEPIFEYTKTKKENELIFCDYYNDMLYKTYLFYPTFKIEHEHIKKILKFLTEYIEKNRPETHSCVGYQKQSKLWSKVSTDIAIDLKNFLNDNVDKALLTWWFGISSERKQKSIMHKSWKTYEKNIDLKKWLTAFENKINNENEPEKSETIKNFIDQLVHHKYKLSRKKTTGDVIGILSNILTSNSFNNFITNEYVKNIFNERYNKFSHIRRRKDGFTKYDIYDSYPDEMKKAYNKVMKTGNVFSCLLQSKNANYSDELKNTLSDYSNSIKKFANDERKTYDYFSKFITNEAIVPACFWDNKILYNK